MDNKEPTDVLFRLKRGLAGYVSYLAACEMNEAFSEYVLYEPILRILMARGFEVECEYPCDYLAGNQHKAGDKKRIDFFVRGHGLCFALEVKWARSNRPDLANDAEKLKVFRERNRDSRSFLCVFGRRIFLESLKLNDNRFKEKGQPVFADFRKTRFGCRIFELTTLR